MIAPKSDPSDAILLRGVRQNNLKSIDCEIPLNRLIAITGVSGSGKSSLAFDTLYAEGQRRYIETFSSYTRQFLDRMARPEADRIENIPPAVAIDQSGAIKTSRSTVGTLTGVNDYLKLLMARAAQAHCPSCARAVAATGVESAVEFLHGLAPEAYPVLITAPVPLGGFDSSSAISRAFAAQGYVRYLRGDEARRLEDLEPRDVKGSVLEVVVDRLSSPEARRSRRADSLEQAFRLGRGSATLRAKGVSRAFTAGLRCGDCNVSVPVPAPGLFSFNNAYGACPRCKGFGKIIEIDERRVVPDGRLSIEAGAIKPFASPSKRRFLRKCLLWCRDRGIATAVPFASLPPAQQRLIFEGDRAFGGVRGFFRHLEGKKYKLHVRVLLARYRGYETCPDCHGARLKPEALYFRLAGRTLAEIWNEPIRSLRPILACVEDGELPKPVRLVAQEISSRLRYLDSVGLGYLTLGRQARTLSGGEVERVHLTAALGASLTGTLFVLDEPSIGLHSRDNERLIGILREVRDRGNTVVVVEHDPEILCAAEQVLDLGPGSGELGGHIVVQGSVAEIEASPTSLTGAYLSGRRRMPVPKARKAATPGHAITVRGARANNLRDLSLDIPLGLLVAITGVSGSGKSTLLEDVLWKSCRRARGEAVEGEVEADRVDGWDRVDQVVLVDQSPIGRTPRGNPATYTKAFDSIRAIFASSPEAKVAGLRARHFSFNVEGGRCPECSGAGATQIEMQFLSDVTLPCEACGGKRFTREVLRVKHRGRSVDEVLAMTVREAAAFFATEPDLVEKLNFLDALGLGYLTLGQPINTLSGGESQRLKLAGHVLEARRGKLLFLLDEPTTGLHLDDVAKLLEVLHGLVAAGHSVVVIEHHLDVIWAADWVIDLGPEGGDEGGRLVATGTPEALAASASQTGSITAQWLERRLERRRKRETSPAESSRELAPGAMAPGFIHVVGARENNLKDITVSIPRDQLVVVTGLSGAGKSSLLYDIIFAEGQRRYLDCMSPYARQFVEELRRPDIDHLEGIPPTVAIAQRTTVGGRKSTVGTVTEVHQFLRLLFAKAGVQTCPDCRLEVVPRGLEEIAREVRRLASRGGRVLAPVVRGKKGFHNRLLAQARRRGILDARVDGDWLAIPEDREVRLERHQAHDIDLVVGRVRAGGAPAAVMDVVSRGIELGNGVVRFLAESGEETILSLQRSCPSCGRQFEEPDPRNFSFHSRHGACEACDGYGSSFALDAELLMARWDLPLESRPQGPLAFLDESPFSARVRARFLRSAMPALERARAPLSRPLAAWPKRALSVLLDGEPDGAFRGLLPLVNAAIAAMAEDDRESAWGRWGKELPCAACGGSRLQPAWAAVQVAGRGLGDLARRTVSELLETLRTLKLSGRAGALGGPIVQEVIHRLEFLDQVGLSYLSLDRSAATLSTGEAQRIRLAAQLGTNLRGVCYILDEPTIGLHSRDGERLLDTLRALRDRKNSVLVVEHDEATIAAADHIIDMGPGPGRHGGEVVAAGTLEQVLQSDRSATAACLRERQAQGGGVDEAQDDAERSFDAERAIVVEGARLHNLTDITARFPLQALTVVTGVSGAGKSTLVRDVLEASLRRRRRGLKTVVGCRQVRGIELVDQVREVNQLPIGRTPRSTPATYVGLWDRVRALFAMTPEAKARGYQAGRFSFNAGSGRCETCAGQGSIRMEMSFLPDVTLECGACRGARFNPETLEVTYRGRSIAQVLGMAVEEALSFFDTHGELTRALQALDDLGLGYLTLGQASTTLSGGEAQRVKLALELGKSSTGACLFLLDEPTTGLHMQDVARLVTVMRRLAAAGHAVVVIEHHLDLIRGADWVIDLGPEGGDAGGQVLYEGPPAGLMKVASSHTGRCLREKDGMLA